MTTLDTIALIAVIIVLVLVRSLTWRAVRPGKLFVLPAVLGIVGLGLIGQTAAYLGADWRPSGADVAVLAGELVIAVVAGAAMGRLTSFRTAAGVVSCRLQTGGAAVFLGFVAVRVLATLLAASIGGTPALLSSSVLLMIAVVKLTQGLVVSRRSRGHTAPIADAPIAAAPSVVEFPQPSWR